MLPLFAPKQTFARIVFLRQGGRLVGKKGTHNVKILAENQTKQQFCHVQTHGNRYSKHERLQPTACVVAGHAAHGQYWLHHVNAEIISQLQLVIS